MSEELTPINRTEVFLAGAAGEVEELPRPINRIEEYLYKIANDRKILEEEVERLDAPWTADDDVTEIDIGGVQYYDVDAKFDRYKECMAIIVQTTAAAANAYVYARSVVGTTATTAISLASGAIATNIGQGRYLCIKMRISNGQFEGSASVGNTGGGFSMYAGDSSKMFDEAVTKAEKIRFSTSAAAFPEGTTLSVYWR